eukprot:scpid82334/ scgid34943/ Uncharacterized oxidoreductase Mvan_2161
MERLPWILAVALTLLLQHSVADDAPSVALANAAKPGTRMPVYGIGTCGYSPGPEVPGEHWNDSVAVKAIGEWLKLGGRRIDTSLDYRDQPGVGQAVRQSGIARDEIFITSKVGGGPLGYNETLDQFKEVLSTLNMTYVDLLLIHWPWPLVGGSSDPACQDGAASANSCRQSSWKAMVEILNSGGARAVGVSNFEIKHIQSLQAGSSLPLPAVNQVEFSPYWHEIELLEFCKTHQIVFNGYAPLATPDWAPHSHHWNASLLDSSVLKKIGDAHSKTPAQVALRWSMQMDVVINPRTWDPEHMKEDLDLNFVLTSDEMEQITNVPKPSNNKVCPDPTNYP